MQKLGIQPIMRNQNHQTSTNRDFRISRQAHENSRNCILYVHKLNRDMEDIKKLKLKETKSNI